MKVSVHDVKGDGSCFFRSVYYSAKYTGKLKYILKHVIGIKQAIINDWTEELFVTEIRKAFAEKLLNGPFLNDIHAYLREVYVNSRDTYDEIIMAYPSWFTIQFKHMPSNIETFKKQFSRHILKKSNWVSQIEVEYFKSILEKSTRTRSSASSKAPLFVIFNKVPSNKKLLDCTTMYILNIDEVHYNYILCRMCTPPKSKIINPKTKRCVKENGQTGKKLLSNGLPVF